MLAFDKPKEVYEKALKICEQKLPNHPERVATLLFAGRNAKHRNEYEQAEEQLNQALDLSMNCLGEHVMTAQCFKDIADLLFFVKRRYQKVNVVLILFFRITKSLWPQGNHSNSEELWILPQ